MFGLVQSVAQFMRSFLSTLNYVQLKYSTNVKKAVSMITKLTFNYLVVLSPDIIMHEEGNKVEVKLNNMVSFI